MHMAAVANVLKQLIVLVKQLGHKGEELQTFVKAEREATENTAKRVWEAVDKWWWYHSLTAHQHQNGHTVPKEVIMIATSIQVATV